MKDGPVDGELYQRWIVTTSAEKKVEKSFLIELSKWLF